MCREWTIKECAEKGEEVLDYYMWSCVHCKGVMRQMRALVEEWPNVRRIITNIEMEIDNSKRVEELTTKIERGNAAEIQQEN
jgi:thiol-disulfide isomerase/thioredoxin